MGSEGQPFRDQPQVWKLTDGRELFIDGAGERVTLTVPGAIEVYPPGEDIPHRVTGRFDLSGLPTDDAFSVSVIVAASEARRVTLCPALKLESEFDAAKVAATLEMIANVRAGTDAVRREAAKVARSMNWALFGMLLALVSICFVVASSLLR